MAAPAVPALSTLIRLGHIVWEHYWIGMVVFLIHFTLCSAPALKKRGAWFLLSILTVFWPVAYALAFADSILTAIRPAQATDP